VTTVAAGMVVEAEATAAEDMAEAMEEVAMAVEATA
jgi:hypothetical protein